MALLPTRRQNPLHFQISLKGLDVHHNLSIIGFYFLVMLELIVFEPVAAQTVAFFMDIHSNVDYTFHIRPPKFVCCNPHILFSIRLWVNPRTYKLRGSLHIAFEIT